MKSFKPIYYVLTLCCLAAFSSCDSALDDTPETGNQSESGTRMSLNITTPSATESDGSSYQYMEECFINDVAVYIFDKTDNGDKLKEQVTAPILNGNNGMDGCRVLGRLNEDYRGTKVKVVVLANLGKNNVTAPALNPNADPDELFNLIYGFSTTANSNWDFQQSGDAASYTPMYGVGEGNIADGEINNISIRLYRAIARVDVVFNDGKGFEGFKVDNITLNRHNTQGTCAANDLNMPNIPESILSSNNAISFFKPERGLDVYRSSSNATDTYPDDAVWRLYIPEYKNIGSSNPAQLTISGHFTQSRNAENRTYTLDFVDTNNEKRAIDIVRNNLYIFRITSIAPPSEPVTGFTCSLEVEEWTTVNNEVTFN